MARRKREKVNREEELLKRKAQLQQELSLNRRKAICSYGLASLLVLAVLYLFISGHYRTLVAYIPGVNQLDFVTDCSLARNRNSEVCRRRWAAQNTHPQPSRLNPGGARDAVFGLK